jgi:hypothetical protein
LCFEEAAEFTLKTSIAHEHEPHTLKEARDHPGDEGEEWYKAAMQEIHSLIENGTFERSAPSWSQSHW